MKVRALISLFRPITASMPTSAAHHRDVARTGSYPSPIREEGFYPIARSCLQEGSYLSSVQRIRALALLDMQPKQVVPYSLYDKYEAEAPVAHVQPPIEPRHIVQHHADSYYSAVAHEPYVPEKPFLSSHDSYSRYFSFVTSLHNLLTFEPLLCALMYFGSFCYLLFICKSILKWRNVQPSITFCLCPLLFQLHSVMRCDSHYLCVRVKSTITCVLNLSLCISWLWLLKSKVNFR